MINQGKDGRVLFMDIDGTTIFWPEDRPDSQWFLTEDWIPNYWLHEAVREFMLSNPDYRMIVWSGGGDYWAKRFAQMFYAQFDPVGMAKPSYNIESYVLPRDVVVDNNPEFLGKFIGSGAQLFLPQEFSIKYMGQD